MNVCVCFLAGGSVQTRCLSGESHKHGGRVRELCHCWQQATAHSVCVCVRLWVCTH